MVLAETRSHSRMPLTRRRQTWTCLCNRHLTCARSVSRLRCFVVLDYTEDVALRVSKPADGDLRVGDVSRRQDDGRAKLLGPLKVGDWIVNLDVDHDGWLNGCVSCAHCTTDATLAGP